jgi:DNA-binding transcriptional ArsR family regulator
MTTKIAACRWSGGSGKLFFMPKRSRSPDTGTDPAQRQRDVLFALLADPVRQRILELLADGKPHTASGTARHVRRRLDAALKHLIALREAGVALTQPDPVDSRRQLYTLAPQFPVHRSETGRVEVDLGCCLVRL